MEPRQPHMTSMYILAFLVIIIVAGAILYPEVRDSFYLSDEEAERRLNNTVDSLSERTDTLRNPIDGDTLSADLVEVVATDLSVPWDIAFLPGGGMLVTERIGTLARITNGSTTRTAVEEVASHGEGGLLGIALHPNFSVNNLLYLYTTTTRENKIINRVVRFTYDAERHALRDRAVIIDNIPGATYHDGGRIAFGPDGFLYATAGDASDEKMAQATSSLAGSILRVTDDGTVPTDNPFGNAIYSYGHRNPQGLAWDHVGRLWSTEHGRSGLKSGFDELNLIQRGVNYGWPDIQGPEVKTKMRPPKVQSGSDTTWAPASALYHDGSIFFGGLRGQALYQAQLTGTEVVGVVRHFYNDFGRIRTVTKGPDGMFYITTSNTDGRGDPRTGDDKIIRINPTVFEQNSQ